MSKFYIGGLVDAHHLGPALEALDKFKISNLDIKLVPEDKEPKRKLLPSPTAHNRGEFKTLVELLRPQIEAMAETDSVVTSKQVIQMCLNAGRQESSAWYGMGEMVKHGILKRIEKGVYQIIIAPKE